MPLTRKTRGSGSSIVVTIPSQLVEAYDINSGDTVEIIPLKDGGIKIKKMNIKHSTLGTVKTRNKRKKQYSAIPCSNIPVLTCSYQ